MNAVVDEFARIERARSPIVPPVDLTLLGEQISLASQLPPADSWAFKVNLRGAILNAVSALREMAKPPTTEDEALLGEHEERFLHVQPLAQAFVLEELVKHTDLLIEAIKAGDTTLVRRFLDAYATV
ncbi:hypothetical protein [Ralstonia pseudosolanacearum]|uniref:hypothetical protein n=1 Tax=Ralstonia pseudosolanacearum TaxID=1310165 RepID=UPI003CF553CE